MNSIRAGVQAALVVLAALGTLAAVPGEAWGFTVSVVDDLGAPVSGFRWLAEEDNTNQAPVGVRTANSISTTIHKSYASVKASGHTTGSSVSVPLPSTAPYAVSILPDGPTHTVGGGRVAPGQAALRVVLHPQPVPTAQVSIQVFHDRFPINNTPELGTEEPLEGFQVVLSDAGGQQMLDAFGNPLGTTYQMTDGVVDLDVDGNPVVMMMGTGVILTGPDGKANVKYLPPNKFGIVVVPPTGEPWIQTSTIEGTPTVDAWVKANEPKIFIEGFGTGFTHVFYGFVRLDRLPWNIAPPASGVAVSGRLVSNHFARPPYLQGFHSGEPISDAFVGLNDALTGEGLVVVNTAADGTFTIPTVPPGTYQLVHWDRALDQLFGFAMVTVGADPVALGDVLSFRWFGKLEGKIFADLNQNGFPDADETQGVPDQALNLRFRNGCVYQSTTTDTEGKYEFAEVFPFFKWLITEVDFARLKATGMTSVVDQGGAIPADMGWDMPSFGILNPQVQAEVNPNTGNALSRTEEGPVLTQAMHLFLGQANHIDWGKTGYAPGENGGISGIVYYAVTRAEDDPRYYAAEPWEPGIPRVQVVLYADANDDKVIDDLNGDGGPTLSDVDNAPFGWMNGGARGAEDVDWNGNGRFDPGDALMVTHTDSFDDAVPTGSIHPDIVLAGQSVQNGFDSFGTWNQVRPGVFDGGYAFGSIVPGGMASGGAEVEGIPTGFYIVESCTPPGYELAKEEDKNVDFGDSYVPSTLALPPIVCGDPHLVPAELSLFPGVPAFYAGQTRPLADRKQVFVTDAKNAAADFYYFTPVPKAGRIVGFCNNDLSAEFDPTSPIYGEKSAPAWIPVALKDWTGHEVVRVYCDEFGHYNALLPANFSNNIGAPSGQSPAMYTAVLNDPLMPDPADPTRRIPDPNYDPSYATVPWTFNLHSGHVTYLDTPIVPTSAFVGFPKSPLDVEAPSGTPVIARVDGPAGGPVVDVVGDLVTLTAAGQVAVPNPAYDVTVAGSPFTVVRDYGFGTVRGRIIVDGRDLAIVSWSSSQVVAELVDGVSTGQLMVVRGDNLRSSRIGVTLHVAPAGTVHRVSPGESIQAAVDAAAEGDLVLVAPGTYSENVIIDKGLTLQGAAAHGTWIVNNAAFLSDALADWHARLGVSLGVADTTAYQPKEAPVVMVTPAVGVTLGDPAVRVDGFTLTSGISGGGIYVDVDAANTVVSNNRVTGNQGVYGGGITVGTAEVSDSDNDGVLIHHNEVLQNGGIRGPGGIAIWGGSTSYRVHDNVVMGNFSRYGGAGIGHLGLSDGGSIDHNQVCFNEVFFGGLAGTTPDGGGIYVGSDPIFDADLVGLEPPQAGTVEGAGSVTIDANLIQGNLAGSGSGGGICARFFNYQDVVAAPSDPTAWYRLAILNNVVVNNVAAMSAGGVFLGDCARVYMVNNTVAFNDSTSTAQLAFAPGSLDSTPHGAGVVAAAHSPDLALLVSQTFTDPVMENNVIWRNRSFFNDHTLNGGAGGLSTAPLQYWDLAVEAPAGTLSPMNCILTDVTGTDPSNVTTDPGFVATYENALHIATILDEGGNAISVRQSSLVLAAGDYHIVPGSAAFLAGPGSYRDMFPVLNLDIDRDWRAMVGDVSIGADELPTLQADLDGDGDVDWADYALFGVWFGTTGWSWDNPMRADLNGDGTVDWADYVLFQDVFHP